MVGQSRQQRMVTSSSVVRVDMDAEDLAAEIESRQDAALQEALDKAGHRAGDEAFKIEQIHLNQPFTVKGRHYASAALAILVDRSEGDDE